MPGGSGEFRVSSWKLNKDYSIDIQGRTTTDSMYDLVAGPKPADVVATAVEVTARSIGAAARFIPPALVPLDVVRSGGGAKNPALVDALLRCWPGPKHRAFDDLFFDGEAKEAVAFALLGYLTWTGRPGNEPGATGAAGPRILGSVSPP